MKTAKLYSGKTVNAYQKQDLMKGAIQSVIKMARNLWNTRTQEYVKENGDIGTCVLGAGITVWYIPPRCRRPRELMIIPSPACAQGSVCWEHSKDEVMEYLKKYGIETNYEWGRMD